MFPRGPRAHRVAIEAEHLPGLRVRVDIPLNVLEVGLHDRHVLGQFQVVVRVSLASVVVVNEAVVAARRVFAPLQVDQLLLHTVLDDEDQERHAVREDIAETEPLG